MKALNKTKKLWEWQWLKETPVAVLEENELPVWRDAGEVVEAVRRMGGGMLRYPAIRWGLHTFGESQYLPKYPGLGGRDLLGEICEAMSGSGIKVMAYCHYGGSLHCEAYRQHPEWASRDVAGKPNYWNGPDHHFCACTSNDDFRRAMRNAIGEIVRNYPVDCVYLDGPSWYRDCYCTHCREKYQLMHGEGFGDALSFDDGTQPKYNRMRDKWIYEALREVREELDTRKPKVALLFNMFMEYMPNHRTGLPEASWELTQGGNTIEVHRPGSFWEMYQSVLLGESLGQVSMGYLPPGPYETLRTFASDELKVLGSAYMMHGATPLLGTVSTYLFDASAGETLRGIVEKMHTHREVYYHSTPVHEVAMIYSRTSAENFAGYDTSHIAQSFGGMFRLMLNAHVPFEAMFDTMVSCDTLKQYRAVVAPFCESLPAKAVDAIRRYVREGGTLLATGRCSLADETGRRGENFQLADVLGVDFVSFKPQDAYRPREYRQMAGRYGYSLIPEAYLRVTDDSLAKVIESNNRLIPVSDAVTGVPEAKRWIDYCIVKAHAQTRVLADLYLPSGGAMGKEPNLPLAQTPGITVNHFGDGRAIYVACPIETHYERRRLAETRRLVACLLDTLLERRLVELDAPAGVIMHLAQGSGRRYLHLLNYCGTMHDDGQAVEEILPVFDLKVRLWRGDFSGCRVSRLSDGSPVELRESGNMLEFAVPRLDVFETFVIE